MSSNEVLKAQLAERQQSPAKAEPTFEDLINQRKQKLQEILPATMNVERFTRVVIGVVNTNPSLKNCTNLSVLSACALSAQLGLEPGPLGHAYMVPFKDKGTPKAQFIIGYKGYIELAHRSGKIQSINVGKVCEHDEFEFEDISEDLQPRLVHRRKMKGNRGPAYAYYVITHYTDGGRQVTLLTRDEVEHYRGRSKAPNSSAWKDDYDAMAIKTVCRRAATFWPLTIEAQVAIGSDNAVTSQLSKDISADLAAEGHMDFIDTDVVDVDPGDSSEDFADNNEAN